jgi:hypothetical protein
VQSAIAAVTLSQQQIPPPWPAELAAMTQPVIVGLQSLRQKTPPPSPSAEFSVIVQPVIVGSLLLQKMPPPWWAEFCVIVQPLMVGVLLKYMQAPPPPRPPAELLLIVQSFKVMSPSLHANPPPSCSAMFPVIEQRINVVP